MNRITEEDYEMLLNLYKIAQTTPVIKFSSDPYEKDLSTRAWDMVRTFQKDLGIKYDYDWEKFAVNDKRELIAI